MKSKRFIATLIFLTYVAALAYLYFGQFGDISEYPKELLGIPLDKCVHFAMFLPYPFLCNFALNCRNKGIQMVFILVTGLILVFLLENMQSLVTEYRTTDIFDLLASIFGLTASASLLSVALLFRHK